MMSTVSKPPLFSPLAKGRLKGGRPNYFCLFLILFPCLLFIISCNNDSQNVLAPEEFSAIYTELLLQRLNPSPSDSTNDFQSILRKHQVTQEKFELTLKHYQEEPELWLALFVDVLKRLESEKSKSDQE